MQEENKNLLIILQLLWSHKIKLLLIVIVSAIASVALALYLPDRYKAVTVVAPVEKDSGSTLTGFGDNISSLAGLTGVSGGTVAEIDIVLETLQSRKFVLDFIDRHDIMLPLMAGYRWDPKTDELIYDSSIYNTEQKKWTFKHYGVPPQEYVYDEFIDKLSVVTDVTTGIIKISFESPSPKLAQEWVDWLIRDVNEFQRLKDIEKSDASIKYLQEQIALTTITEVRNIFYELIKEQHKIRLLANTREEYSLSIIDPASVPDIKSGPNRLLIVILGVFTGFFFGFLMIYSVHLFINRNSSDL